MKDLLLFIALVSSVTYLVVRHKNKKKNEKPFEPMNTDEDQTDNIFFI